MTDREAAGEANVGLRGLVAGVVLAAPLLAACATAASGKPEPPASVPAFLPLPTITAAEESSPPVDIAALDATLRPPPESPPAVPQLIPAASAPAPVNAGGAEPPAISALSAVVMDEASGEVLYDRDAHRALAPASLTKIATAIVALERGDMDALVEADVDSTQMRSSTVMGLLPGDTFRLRDLMYGLMLPSGNDAALAIGRAVAGSDAAFVAQMNLLAARLGLRDTRFENPHGLGNRRHLTSAYDLALLTRYAMTFPLFRELAGTGGWKAEGSRTLWLGNLNTFLFTYPGADGVKTGYTRSAGKTIVASAVRNGHRLYAVVLNAPNREQDAAALLDWAFANFRWTAQ
jgi:D-alanyl-D-alanine carboxypeptidase